MKLTFDPSLHEYRVDGARVPGVTSVLRPLVDFSRVPPAVLEAKADLGRRVHLACQYHDEHDLDESSVEAEVAPYLTAYRRFLVDTGAEVIENERQVFNRVHRYAGTLDRVLYLRGEFWLVDLKTSITTPITVGPQTAAYMHAIEDVPLRHRAALRLRPDGTYRLDELHNPNDWSTFLAALTLHRYAEMHEA
ncbi:MAG: hypothetical protein WCK28_00255 [Burkholderiales bacterium]